MESADHGIEAETAPTIRQVSVCEGYQLWAETYDFGVNPLLALEERILEPLLPEVKGRNVLDVACGTGRWLRKLLRRGAKLATGVDFSAEMLAQAAAKPSLRGCILRADCRELPFQTSFADLAVCSFVVGYLEELRSFAAELSRVSRPDAQVFVTDFHPEAYRRGWKRTFRHSGGITEVRSFAHGLEEIRSAFAEEEFELLSCVEPCFDWSEQEIFARNGKEHLFESASNEPAIFVCQFRRRINAALPKSSKISAPVISVSAPHHSSARLMKFVGARVGLDGNTACHAEIEIENGLIKSVVSPHRELRGHPPNYHGHRADTQTIDLTGYLILPGLINAHDHLEFNLFPRLGAGPHDNFQQWAREIYHPDCSPVREHLEVSKRARLWWGAIKNLLCGVTTVCHHNPFEPEVFGADFPVRVVSRYGWAHSLALGKDVASEFALTSGDAPFIIHLGEGTDAFSREEIYQLDRLGALDERTVIVHGVALDEAGHALLSHHRAALVWCPTSNMYTLGKTLDRKIVEHNSKIALGNDSALTAEGDLLDEVRAAYRLTGVAAEELFALVTRRPASILRLSNGTGAIEEGAAADLIAIRDCGGRPAAVLVNSSFRDVELVLLGGEPRLLSPRMADRWPHTSRKNLNQLRVEGVERWVSGPVPGLLQEATAKLGSDLRLAGKRISA